MSAMRCVCDVAGWAVRSTSHCCPSSPANGRRWTTPSRQWRLSGRAAGLLRKRSFANRVAKSAPRNSGRSRVAPANRYRRAAERLHLRTANRRCRPSAALPCADVNVGSAASCAYPHDAAYGPLDCPAHRQFVAPVRFSRWPPVPLRALAAAPSSAKAAEKHDPSGRTFRYAPPGEATRLRSGAARDACVSLVHCETQAKLAAEFTSPLPL